MSAPVEVPPFSCLPPTTVVQVPGPAGSAASVTNAAVLAALATPLPIANGGTGQATQALALAAILGASAVPIANGGTAATTKAGAQTALGLGQNHQQAYGDGLSLAIPLTSAIAIITGATITASAAGRYAMFAHVGIDLAGATFASSRVLSLRIRNTTTNTNYLDTSWNTGVLTTTTLPTLGFPLLCVGDVAASDVMQVWAGISVAPTAGAITVASFQFVLVPLRLS